MTTETKPFDVAIQLDTDNDIREFLAEATGSAALGQTADDAGLPCSGLSVPCRGKGSLRKVKPHEQAFCSSPFRRGGNASWGQSKPRPRCARGW